MKCRPNDALQSPQIWPPAPAGVSFTHLLPLLSTLPHLLFLLLADSCTPAPPLSICRNENKHLGGEDALKFAPAVSGVTGAPRSALRRFQALVVLLGGKSCNPGRLAANVLQRSRALEPLRHPLILVASGPSAAGC